MESFKKLLLTATVDFPQYMSSTFLDLPGKRGQRLTLGCKTYGMLRVDVGAFKTRIPEDVAFRVRGGRTNLVQDGKPHSDP